MIQKVIKSGAAVILTLVILGCTVSPVTGKKQIASADNRLVEKLSAAQYQNLVGTAKAQGLVDSDDVLTQRVNHIAQKIIVSSKQLMSSSRSWDWEVHVIENDQLNAFCMPGGKIVVYSGIVNKLNLTDDEIAVILGHEAAHALMGHGAQRVTLNIIQNALLSQYSKNTGDVTKAKDLEKAANILFSLPFSRAHEREADRVGLQLAMHAGFEPNAAVTVWNKMDQASKSKPNPLLSTHPMSSERASYLGQLSSKIGDKNQKSLLIVDSVADDFEKFTQGNWVLGGGVSQAFASGYNRKQMDSLHRNEAWRELAIVLIGGGRDLDLHYFYLAEAARGLGYGQAAKIYYTKAQELSVSTDMCGQLFDYQCNGIHVWNQATAALSLLDDEDAIDHKHAIPSELRKLKEEYYAGSLSEEEYSTKKKNLLNMY